MRAISGLGTVQEPLFDKTRVAENAGYGTRRNSILPENLDETFPMPKWTRAHQEKERRFPQTISHRGFKAQNPENTMQSFRAAVEAGTHALETDIHLSKDDVVVLSHDQDLKRCFGKEDKILDCDWEFLSQQRTIMAPHEPMPRLSDLLEYLAQPEHQHLWLLLDIKVDNDATKVMKLIAETISSVDPGSTKWKDRVVLGIWAIRYLPLCAQFLPGFSVSFIGWSTWYARQFLKVPNVSFNMLQKVLHGPIGSRFIRDVKKANRPLYVWTVNDVNLMKWSIQKEVDGVITDNPKLFREVCENWTDKEPAAKLTWHQFFQIVWIYSMIVIFWIPFRRRFPEPIKMFLQTKDGTAATAQKVKR